MYVLFLWLVCSVWQTPVGEGVNVRRNALIQKLCHPQNIKLHNITTTSEQTYLTLSNQSNNGNSGGEVIRQDYLFHSGYSQNFNNYKIDMFMATNVISIISFLQ